MPAGRQMAKIIKWEDHQGEPVAQCMCGGIEFYILVNGYGDSWDKVIGTECVECGYEVKWVKAEKQE
jgi:hypothetical protein